MASWLTHLRIAEKIKEKIKGIDLSYLMMGSIAPDAVLFGAAKSGSIPVEEETFYKLQTVVADNQQEPEFNQELFYQKHLVPEKLFLRSDMTRSFLWGYYFHLLTDQMWVEHFVKPFSADYKERHQDTEQDFSGFLEEEMLGLDFSYLRENGYELLEELKRNEVNLSFFYDFDPDIIVEFKERVIDTYYKEEQPLQRDYEYLKSGLLEEFIDKAAERCIAMLV